MPLLQSIVKKLRGVKAHQPVFAEHQIIRPAHVVRSEGIGFIPRPVGVRVSFQDAASRFETAGLSDDFLDLTSRHAIFKTVSQQPADGGGFPGFLKCPAIFVFLQMGLIRFGKRQVFNGISCNDWQPAQNKMTRLNANPRGNCPMRNMRTVILEHSGMWIVGSDGF